MQPPFLEKDNKYQQAYEDKEVIKTALPHSGLGEAKARPLPAMKALKISTDGRVFVESCAVIRPICPAFSKERRLYYG
jgi:hypothetical protein